MIANTFEYARAGSVEEAIAKLKDDPNAKLLAGGHSLIPAMKLRLNAPGMLIDISRIPELNFIRDRGKYIAIGAATTHGTIASHKTTVSKLPLLAQAAGHIGDPAVRNRGTIGGSIAHADPAADWPGVLIAADATIVVHGPFGERRIPAEDFFKGFFYTELAANEVITEIHVPEPDAATLRCYYAKFEQPASRFALAGCAVQLTMDGNTIAAARVGMNGVADHAYRARGVEAALEGREATPVVIADAAQYAAENAGMVLSDAYASEEYRRHLAVVFTKRALMGALGL
jgi:carbon-monoxide dehydrogenase medium subunit